MPPRNHSAWETVERGEKQASGNYKLVCRNCRAEFIGGGTKVVGHVAGGFMALKANVRPCTKAPRELRARLIQEHDARNRTKRARMEEELHEAREAQILEGDQDAADAAADDGGGLPTARARAHGSGIAVGDVRPRRSAEFVVRGRVKLTPSLKRTHVSLARGLMSAGISFKALRNKHFRDALCDIAKYGALYLPPDEESVRVKYAGIVGKEVEAKERVFLEANTKIGGTLCDDGWKDNTRNNVLNACFVCPEGALFVRTKDVTGLTKDAAMMHDSLVEAIEQVGAKRVVHVVTDNASVMVAARRLLAIKYPHITCSGCAAHVLDLLLEDLGKLDWVAPSLQHANAIVNFVRNHGDAEAAMKRHGAEHALLKQVETRFGSKFNQLQSALKLRVPLRAMATDPALVAKARRADWYGDFQDVCGTVLDDEFWDHAQDLVALVEPIILLLRLCDGDTPCCGKVYHKVFQLGEELAAFHGLDVRRQREVTALFTARWNMLYSDMHGAGYCLDPEYWDPQYGQEDNEEVMDSLRTMCEKVHGDYDEDGGWVVDYAKCNMALNEFVTYRRGLGSFAKPMCRDAMKTMPAHRFWYVWGGSVPHLKKVALWVLSQVTSSSSCERVNSECGWVKDKYANRMLPENMERLVKVHHNLRILDKISDFGYEETNIVWDVDALESDEEEEVQE